jgi:hypothetical protein
MLNWEISPMRGNLKVQFFKVQYKTGKRRFQWMTLDEEIPPHIRSYLVSDLKSGERYKFRISAAFSNNDHAVGPTSKKFLLEPDSPDLMPLNAPEIVDTKSSAFDSIEIKWTYDSGGEKTTEMIGFYIFYRSTTSAGDFLKITLIGSDIRSHVLKHLEAATTYDIKIQSFQIGGTSKFSSLRTAKTLGKDGVAPTGAVDNTKTGPNFDNGNNHSFSLPKSFPLYGIVAVIVSAVVILVALPCLICFLRRKCRSQSPPTFKQTEFQDTALKISRNGTLPNGARPLSSAFLEAALPTPTSNLTLPRPGSIQTERRYL